MEDDAELERMTVKDLNFRMAYVRQRLLTLKQERLTLIADRVRLSAIIAKRKKEKSSGNTESDAEKAVKKGFFGR